MDTNILQLYGYVCDGFVPNFSYMQGKAFALVLGVLRLNAYQVVDSLQTQLWR